MSQEASTYQASYEPLEDYSASPSWSMEAYADGLMDELFSDIDGVLDGSGNLPSEPVQSEYVSLQTITVPQIVLPATLVLPNTEGFQQPTALSTVVVDPATNNKQRRWSRWFGVILLVTASATAAIAALLWLAGHRDLNQAVQTSPVAQRQLQIKADDDKFIDYMQRALERIDQKQVEAGQIARLSNQVKPEVPTVPVPGGQALAPRTPANVLERVYIPVYQPPQPNTLALPGIPSVSNLPRTKAPDLPRVVLPRPVAPTLVVPSRPVLSRPAVVAPAPSPSATATQSAPTAPTLTATHTLTGLMDLGSKSAALFAVDGVTHRIQVGESIGATGWTLVEVSNNQAIIRRNGEVRSIYVGQKL